MDRRWISTATRIHVIGCMNQSVSCKISLLRF